MEVNRACEIAAEFMRRGLALMDKLATQAPGPTFLIVGGADNRGHRRWSTPAGGGARWQQIMKDIREKGSAAEGVGTGAEQFGWQGVLQGDGELFPFCWGGRDAQA